MTVHHHHDHDHPHDHAHTAAQGSSRKLVLALGLTLGFAAVEAVAGWLSGSLALLGDAAHMLTDSLSLGLAAGAAVLAQRPPSRRHSYGLGRAEILAAFINACAMVAIVILIAVEAVDRISHPQPVQGGIVLGVALIGLAINLVAVWLLSGHGHDLNVRGALLHVIGDLLGSVAALVSGAVILLTGWTLIDPILSLLIMLLVLVSAMRLLREALHALMEGVPLHLDLGEVGRAMTAVAGVQSVHDLHIWTVSSSRIALSAHVVLRHIDDWPPILAQLQHALRERFGIMCANGSPSLRSFEASPKVRNTGRVASPSLLSVTIISRIGCASADIRSQTPSSSSIRVAAAAIAEARFSLSTASAGAASTTVTSSEGAAERMASAVESPT